MTHQLSQPEIGNIEPSRGSTGNGQSGLSDAKFLVYKSDTNMRAALTTAGYTAADLKVMTQNDLQYAVSLLNL